VYGPVRSPSFPTLPCCMSIKKIQGKQK
jgi:hypothetical protein